MVDVSGKMYERDGIETKVDNDGILWSNKKHIWEGLDHKNLRQITTKCHSDHSKHRYQLIKKPKEHANRILIHEKLAIKIIFDCKATLGYKFRARLGLKRYDVILTKGQSLLTKIKSSFEGENTQT